MKQLFIILGLAIGLYACSGGTKKKAEESVVVQNEGLVSYTYKVVGLQDSIISDSIWRIIFQVEGIDKLVLSKDDSIALFSVNPELVSDSLLQAEITSRGGVLLD